MDQIQFHLDLFDKPESGAAPQTSAALKKPSLRLRTDAKQPGMHSPSFPSSSFSITPAASSIATTWRTQPIAAFEDWMNQANNGKGFKERSRTVYRAMWNKLVKHVGLDAAFLGTEQIQEFLGSVQVRRSKQTLDQECSGKAGKGMGERGLVSLTQQRRYIVLLASVQEYLVRAGALQESTASPMLNDLEMQEAAFRRSLPVALTPEQEERIRLAIGHLTHPSGRPQLQDNKPESPRSHADWMSMRNGAMVAMLLGCGVKVHELQSLRMGDLVRESNGMLVAHATTNGSKERRAPMSEFFDKQIAPWLQWMQANGAPENAPVFFSSNDDNGGNLNPDLDLPLGITWKLVKPMSSTQIWRVVSAMFIECGIEGRLARHGPTVLRNTFATRNLRMGVPIDRVAMWLGHRDPNSTKVLEALISGAHQSAGAKKPA